MTFFGVLSSLDETARFQTEDLMTDSMHNGILGSSEACPRMTDGGKEGFSVIACGNPKNDIFLLSYPT